MATKLPCAYALSLMTEPRSAGVIKTDIEREQEIFNGELPQAFAGLVQSALEHFMHKNPDVPKAWLKSTVHRRAMLLFCESLEGWVVSVSRWVLQASTTSYETSHRGPIHKMFRACEPAIQPPVSKLLQRVREHGVVRRSDIALALMQCASHHDLFKGMATTHNASVIEASACRQRFAFVFIRTQAQPRVKCSSCGLLDECSRSHACRAAQQLWLDTTSLRSRDERASIRA